MVKGVIDGMKIYPGDIYRKVEKLSNEIIQSIINSQDKEKDLTYYLIEYLALHDMFDFYLKYQELFESLIYQEIQDRGLNVKSINFPDKLL